MLERPSNMLQSPMMDPLSNALGVVAAKCVVSGTLQAGGTWAVRFPPAEGIKFLGVVRGTARMKSGRDAAITVRAGDVVLRAAPQVVVMGSDLGATPTELATLVRDRKGSALARVGTGDEFAMVGGEVLLAEEDIAWFRATLPPTIAISAGSERAATLQWLMAEIVREQKQPALGGEVAIGQLALLMFVQILRAHADSEASTGWLAGLADRRLAPAFARMHGSPERAWTLPELARACAMSRAAFADRFKQIAGTTPLAYLAAWRIRLARHGLERGASIGELADQLGYSSENSLSHAFKRIAGTSPRAYRDAVR